VLLVIAKLSFELEEKEESTKKHLNMIKKRNRVNKFFKVDKYAVYGNDEMIE
jgi:hypothetical protein